METTFIKTIEVEFPTIIDNGKFYTLDLSNIVPTKTYKKCFTEEILELMLKYGTDLHKICFAELWIIKNNPKYNYLYKEQKIAI